MNNKFIFTIGLLIGAGLGFTAGKIFSDRTNKKELDLLTAQVMKDIEHNRSREIKPSMTKEQADALQERVNGYKKQLNDILEEEKKSKNGHKSYNHIYDPETKSMKKIESSELKDEVFKPDPDALDESEQYDEGFVAHQIHQANRFMPPEIVPEEELEHLPQHLEYVGIVYFVNHDAFVEEDGEAEIPVPYELFGDTLIVSDFENSDEDTIYILNHELDTIYEITKSYEYYESMNGNKD